jgi:primosomal protein N''
MTINQALADILDETVKALSDLDSHSLQALEQRIVALAESSERYERDDAGLILSKKRLLEIVLQNCQVNLDALTRLHARNMRNQWAQ